MKIKKIALFTLLFCSIASGQALAVDGYKNVKFGSTFSQLQASKICSWKKYEGNKVNGMDTYYCQDLSFAGKPRVGMAFFVDKKFERLAIPITKDINFDALIDSLKRKYGEPSSLFTREQIEKAMSEGGEVSIKYDNDTVIVGITKDGTTKQETTLLVYTSKDYFDKVANLQSSALDGDL